MTVFILEPSAVEFNRTHTFQGLTGHTEILRANNLEVIWLINHHSPAHQREGVKSIHPVFHYTIYDDIGRKVSFLKKPVSWFKKTFLIRRTLKDLKSAFNRIDLSNKDHLLVPVTDWIIFSALMKWVEGRPVQSLPVIHFVIMYEVAPWMVGGYPYEKIIGKLRRMGVIRDRIHLYTETLKHAQNLRKENLGITVDVCPYPIVAKLAPGKTDTGQKEISVCLLGGGRRDKGFQHMFGIISKYQKLANDREQVQFILQFPRAMDRLEAEVEKIASLNGVKLLENQLSQSDYHEYLHQSDIMIFPYTRGVYETRGSGIVCQAVAAGKPIVVTRSTALAERITHDNGLEADVGDEFAKAILEIVRNIEIFKRNAEIAREHFNNEVLNSSIIQNIKKHN